MSREKRVRKARAEKNTLRRRVRRASLAREATMRLRELYPEWYAHIKTAPMTAQEIWDRAESVALITFRVKTAASSPPSSGSR